MTSEKVIKNCLITRSDARVVKEYCASTESPLYRQYKGFNTSVNLTATDVYTMYAGTVSMISGDKKSGLDVVVLINQQQAIRYRNLKEVSVKLNEFADISQKIGVAKTAVWIEYLSTHVKNQFPFRMNNTVMYKDDPMKILDIETTAVSTIGPQYSESGLMDFMDEYNGGYSWDMFRMLSDNRGSDY